MARNARGVVKAPMLRHIANSSAAVHNTRNCRARRKNGRLVGIEQIITNTGETVRNKAFSVHTFAVPQSARRPVMFSKTNHAFLFRRRIRSGGKHLNRPANFAERELHHAPSCEIAIGF